MTAELMPTRERFVKFANEGNLRRTSLVMEVKKPRESEVNPGRRRSVSRSGLS